MYIYFIWLSLVVVWNYRFPDVPPIADVAVAVLLSFVSQKLKLVIKPSPSKLKMKKSDRYWHENIQLIIKCLLVWFTVSYVFGIVIVEELNLIRLGGYKLGFWFAQQGSIFTFVLLIFYYSNKISELDDKYDN
jgi:putative solute:sodium symporter small subunit